MSDLSAREILDKLVGFPTVSSSSNLDLITWVEDYLAGYGVASTRVYDETGTKAGLYANVGPEVEGGVALCGHTDVVPVEGQDWVTDPWVVTEKEGRLYGRGTCDMKGFNALALAAVPKALRAGIKRPIQIAFTRDEEVGLLGAPGLCAAMREGLPPAAAMLIGEPTSMKVANGHKSCDGFHVHVRGFEVHSSNVHQGVSAVMIAARLIEWCRTQLETEMAKEASAEAALFSPPFTTFHCGVINGGTAANITAKDCHLTVDIRTLPGEEHFIDAFRIECARLAAEMQAVHPATGIDLEHIPGPGVRPEVNGAAETLARQLTGDNAPNTVSYGTDGGHFQLGGYSTVICGPGDIAQAHQPNEFITIEQFTKGEGYLDRLVDHLAA